VAMQFYASPEQIMRDRSEFARKMIARGRNVVVMSYSGGVLFVTENPSKALHKVSEIYDRIGFAAVGRYNEFENLRAAGVRMADLRGYSYDRRDVTGRAIATAFAQTLGSIFTVETKPYEVEICIAEVTAAPATDELYRITYDGQAQEEQGFLAMGGQTDVLSKLIREKHTAEMSLTDAVQLAVEAIASVGGEAGKPRTIDPNQLEVAVLDRVRPGRKFRRITGAALTPLLESAAKTPETPAVDTAATPAPGESAAGTSTTTAASANGSAAATTDTATTNTPTTDTATTDTPTTDTATGEPSREADAAAATPESGADGSVADPAEGDAERESGAGDEHS
jgi:proteasome alpha subunit